MNNDLKIVSLRSRSVSPWWRHGVAGGLLLLGYAAAGGLFWFAPSPADLSVARAPLPARVEASAVAEPEVQLEALAEAGRFADAVRLAESAPAGNRDTLLSAACSLWAIDDPAAAARHVFEEADPVKRGNLLRHVASVWAGGRQAPDLVAFALRVSTDAERGILLDAGLPVWVMGDVVGAATWLSQQSVRPELDAGFAAVAIHPAVLASQPDLAADSAARVMDVELRRTVLAIALKALHRIDPEAADRRLSEDRGLGVIETSHLRGLLADL